MGKATSVQPKIANNNKRVARVAMKPASTKPNLRDQQRADVTIEVTVKKPNGDSLSCTASNLSRAGIMLLCDFETVKQLIPNQTTPAPGDWIYVTTRFAIPVVAAQTVSVAADGHIVHLRRIARDQFQVGVQFIEFENNGFNYVDQYVSKLLSATA